MLLRADAAAAVNWTAAAGGMPCAGNSYRSYGQQVSLYRVKPSLAAVHGTSNHGWGVAIDFARGADRFGCPAYQWLTSNGPPSAGPPLVGRAGRRPPGAVALGVHGLTRRRLGPGSSDEPPEVGAHTLGG